MPDKECSIFDFVSRELQKSHGLHIFWITLVSVVIIKGEKKTQRKNASSCTYIADCHYHKGKGMKTDQIVHLHSTLFTLLSN